MKLQMKKILTVLITGLFAASTFAASHAGAPMVATPAKPATPTMVVTPANPAIAVAPTVRTDAKSAHVAKATARKTVRAEKVAAKKVAHVAKATARKTAHAEKVAAKKTARAKTAVIVKK